MGAGASSSRGSDPSAPVGQWADRVVSFSSQIDGDGSAAAQALGRPKVFPAYGDKPGAWTPGSSGTGWIELEFPRAVFMHGIEIYETFNPGAVIKVLVLSPRNTWECAWRGEPQHLALPARSRIFAPPVLMPPFMVRARGAAPRRPTPSPPRARAQPRPSRDPAASSLQVRSVRLEVDTTESSGWSEIDAVRLLGKQRWEGGDASHVAHWAAFQESVRESTSNSITIGGRGLSQRHSFPRSDPNASVRRTAWGSNDAENQAPQSPSPSAGEVHLRKRVEVLEQQVAASPNRAPSLCPRCPFAI